MLTRWVFEDLGFAGGRIEPASADASFRRYFRVTRGADTYIVMDAPPDKEDLEPFVSVAQVSARASGLNVPVVLARDERQGLLLLSDLGTRQYLDELACDGATSTGSTRMRWMRLITMQTRGGAAARDLPRYEPRPADARNGADAGVVFGAPSRAAPRGRRARHAGPAVRDSGAKRARSSPQRSCIATITRGICW